MDTTGDDIGSAHKESPMLGFWMAAAPAGPCDQTIESYQESARFYTQEFPREGSECLKTYPDGVEWIDAIAAEAFVAAYGATAPQAAQSSKGISRRVASLGEATDNISFTYHPDELGRHLGCVFFFFDATIFLPSRHGEFWKATAKSRSIASDFSLKLCGHFLDAMQERWGLSPPTLLHQRGEARPHWGEQWPPSCMDSPINGQACALLEAFQIAQASSEAGRSRARSL